MSGEPIDPGVVERAGRVVDLARGGPTEEPAAYVDAGVPVDLTDDDEGGTPLIATVHHGHGGTVGALLDRGADRGRSARATAALSEAPPMVELLDGR